MQQTVKKGLTRFSVITFVFFLFILIGGSTVANFVFAENTIKTEFRFIKALQRGSRGEDVKQLQEFLKQYSDTYPEGLVTGYFGSLTETAVQRFQTKFQIVSSGSPVTTGYGLVGPKTRAKLNERLSQKIKEAPTPTAGSTTTPTATPTATPTPIAPATTPTSTSLSMPAQTNNQLPQFIEWAKAHEITLIRTSREVLGGMTKKIWNPATDEMPLTDAIGIDQSFESLKKIPPHLIRLLEGQTIFFLAGDCGHSHAVIAMGSLVKLSKKYQMKPLELPEGAIQEIALRVPKDLLGWEANDILPTGKAYNFYNSESVRFHYSYDIYLCGIGSLTHEFGHLVDFNGIKMHKGYEYALGGKTDEGIRALYEEYSRIFYLSKEYSSAYGAGTLTTPPQGYISTYSAVGPTEEFAESFAYYIDNPQYFRERAAKEPGLAEKYEFLKTKVFLGKEY